MNITSTSIFFPRGGSAQVIRYLGAQVRREGHDFDVFAGSLPATERSDARRFYGELCAGVVDYSDAAAAHSAGRDPILHPVPFHPSFEDKPGVPDRSFARVGPEGVQNLVEFWVGFFEKQSLADVDMVHLNHLSPLQAAARRAAPDVPIVSTLHGTEIKFWQSLLRGGGQTYRELWLEQMAAYAEASDRIVVISRADHETVTQEFGVPEDKVVHIPHGVDVERFHPSEQRAADSSALWHRLLVYDATPPEIPGGGALSYSSDDVERLLSPSRVRLLWLGRFLHQKRLNELLEAYAEAVRTTGTTAAMVVWGGYPGEHEGVHPHVLAEQLGIADQVFFVGWRGHDDLAEALPTVDALTVPSVNESFGLMYLEAMASGIPVLATRTGGPPDFVRTKGEDATGWLVPPDDNDALVGALTQLLTDPEERRRRGANALFTARRDFSWQSVARKYLELFEVERKRRGGSDA